MDQESRDVLHRLVSKWTAEVAGHADDQEINVSSMCHSSGYTTSWRSTAGEFRKLLQQAHADALTNNECSLLVSFSAGRSIDFTYHDSYSVEVVSPEVRDRDAKATLFWKQITDLQALGVDSSLFVNWAGPNPNGEVIFTPEKVVELAEIIRNYLALTRKTA